MHSTQRIFLMHVLGEGDVVGMKGVSAPRVVISQRRLGLGRVSFFKNEYGVGFPVVGFGVIGFLFYDYWWMKRPGVRID